MRKLTLGFCLFILAFVSAKNISAQQSDGDLIVYYTYEDYLNGTGINYGKGYRYTNYFHAMGSVTLFFKNENAKKVKIKCKSMWGFSFRKSLFRNDKRFGQPTRVMSSGKITYYENGLAHLDMVQDNSTSGNFSVGYYCYISENLGTEFLQIPASKSSDGWKELKKFEEEKSAYKPFFECLNKNYDYPKVRTCVNLFNTNE